MDYNHPSNYHCHPTAASTVSPKAKLLDGGDPVVTATTTTKGPKLKALPATNLQINGGRVADHQRGTSFAGARDTEVAVMNHHTNGHHIRESSENVMPSNNLHCTHNVSNNSLRSFSNQMLCHENGTKREHLHQQHLVGILKGKGLRRNGDDSSLEEIDNNYQRIMAAEANHSSNIQMRRIRGRSECTEPVDDDAYYSINGWNVKATGGGEGGVTAGLINGSTSSSMFKGDSDVSSTN